MQHSPRSQRPFYVIGTGLGTLVFFCGAVALGRYAFTEARVSGGAMHFATMLAWTVTMALMGGAFAAVCVATVRGPPREPARVIGSDERVTCYALLIVTFFTGSLAASIRRSLVGLGDAAPVVGHFMVWGLAMLSVYCALGLASIVYQLMFSGRSRLHMPERVVYAGQMLEAQLEIPFAADAAPRVEAELALIFSLSTPGADVSHIEETQMWAESCELGEWVPAGAGACRASLRVETRAGTPSGLGRSGTNFFWKLNARSTTDGKEYLGSFIVPIAFADAYAEGITGIPGHERLDVA